MTKTNVIIFGFILLLSGCSANWHIKRSARHELIAISKGAQIYPDTVWKVLKFTVPAVESGAQVKPVIDSTKFKTVIEKYDSAVIAASNMVTWEEHLKAQKTIQKLRSRLIKGFSKDSVYTFLPDSLTQIKVTVKDGLIDSVAYNRKESEIKASVPIVVTKVVSAAKSWMSNWLLFLLAGFAAGALLVFFVRR